MNFTKKRSFSLFSMIQGQAENERMNKKIKQKHELPITSKIGKSDTRTFLLFLEKELNKYDFPLTDMLFVHSVDFISEHVHEIKQKSSGNILFYYIKSVYGNQPAKLKTLQDVSIYLCKFYKRSFVKSVSVHFEYNDNDIELCNKSTFVFCETLKTNSFINLHLSNWYVCCSNILVENKNTADGSNLPSEEQCKKWLTYVHQKDSKLVEIFKQWNWNENQMNMLCKNESELEEIQCIDSNFNVFDCLEIDFQYTVPHNIDVHRTDSRKKSIEQLSETDYFKNNEICEQSFRKIMMDMEKLFFNSENVTFRNIYLEVMYEPIYLKYNYRESSVIKSIVIGKLEQNIFSINDYDDQSTKLLNQFRQTINVFYMIFYKMGAKLCIRDFNFSDRVSDHFFHDFPNTKETSFFFCNFSKCDVWNNMIHSLTTITSLKRLNDFSITFGQTQNDNNFHWFNKIKPESVYQFLDFNNQMKIK